jgi:hypothetical protein
MAFNDSLPSRSNRITAAGFYAHETNCEHVQIIAPVRGSDAWLNIKWMCRTSEDRSEPPWTVTWEAFLKDGRLYVKRPPCGGDTARRNPITGIAGCCAHAVSGHAAVAPPRGVQRVRPVDAVRMDCWP